MQLEGRLAASSDGLNVGASKKRVLLSAPRVDFPLLRHLRFFTFRLGPKRRRQDFIGIWAALSKRQCHPKKCRPALEGQPRAPVTPGIFSVLKFCPREIDRALKRLAQSGIHSPRYFFLHCNQKKEGIDSAGDFGESKNRFSLV
jgi:hypothetical protein